MSETKKETKFAKEQSIAETFARIEETIEKLQSDDIPIEKAFQLFQDGMAQVKYCDGAIDKIEKKVMKVTEENQIEELD